MPEQLPGIQEDISPMAPGARRAVGGMGYVFRDNGHIPCPERERFAEEFHVPAVRMADADFKTIVEMLPPAGDIGNPPVLAREQQDGEIHRKIVIAVFCDGIL